MENINMKNSEETMIECNFTESEIKMLSDVVLMQTCDAINIRLRVLTGS